MNLRIVGGRLIDPANQMDEICDVYVYGGKVAGLGTPPEGFVADESIDAGGCMVLPGIIDMCARLCMPVVSETRAAACSGITHMVCPPDTFATIDTPAMVRMLYDHAASSGFARVLPLGALTIALAGEKLADMALLMDAGCVGFSNGLKTVKNTLVMRRALQYASTYGLPIFITPSDPWLHGNGVVHEGEISTRLGLPAIPEAAEIVGVARDLVLIETSGARAHFSLLSAGRSVEMIAEAIARCLPLTAGVAIHHLHLNEKHIGMFDTRYKVFPPLRTERDQRALIDGVNSGTISVICSDHQPHSADVKLSPFVEAAAGIAGFDTLLPLTMDLVRQGTLELMTAVAALTTNPATIIGIDAGHLGVGANANICLFDPACDWRLDHNSMQSYGKNSPWLGQTMRGKTIATIIDGRIVYRQ